MSKVLQKATHLVGGDGGDPNESVFLSTGVSTKNLCWAMDIAGVGTIKVEAVYSQAPQDAGKQIS